MSNQLRPHFDSTGKSANLGNNRLSVLLSSISAASENWYDAHSSALRTQASDAFGARYPELLSAIFQMMLELAPVTQTKPLDKEPWKYSDFRRDSSMLVQSSSAQSRLAKCTYTSCYRPKQRQVNLLARLGGWQSVQCTLTRNGRVFQHASIWYEFDKAEATTKCGIQ